MLPAQLAKSGTEHGEQVALFAYVAVAYLHGWEIADEWSKNGPNAFKQSKRKNGDPPAIPALEWFHAIHNQGHGDKVRGGMAKAEGVRKGVSDTFLPWPVSGWHGLYIEMKKKDECPKREGSKGGVTEEQAAFGEYLKRVGYGFMVCYGWDHAATTLRRYIEWKG